jgi:hypothetical protein
VIILFCEPLIGFSFGETSYFDQNGNPVSKEEYEKISKKKAEKPSAQSPDATQAKPKPVTTEQKQPIPPVQQTRSESQEDIRKKILDAYSKIPHRSTSFGILSSVISNYSKTKGNFNFS